MREIEDRLPDELKWREQFNACRPEEEDCSAGLGTGIRPVLGSETSSEASTAVAAQEGHGKQQENKESKPAQREQDMFRSQGMLD